MGIVAVGLLVSVGQQRSLGDSRKRHGMQDYICVKNLRRSRFAGPTSSL